MEKLSAFAIMDHPGNLRPSRYHVRDYGLFSINPFGNRAYTNGVRRSCPGPSEEKRIAATALRDAYS